MANADADMLEARMQLAAAIHRILEKRGLSHPEIAKALGVNQPKVSALLGFKLEGFSVERLMRFVTALEHDVVISISPRRRRGARVTVRSGPVRKAAAKTRVKAVRA